MDTVLACDLGGSTCRAALVDAKGTFLAEWSAPAPAEMRPNAHWVEIDADAWWRFLGDATDALAGAASDAFDNIAAIAICGLTRTQVLLGPNGRPLRPALGFGDARAEDVLNGLRDRLPPDHPETAGLNAYHPVARLAWVAAQEPDLMAQVTAVCDPKDYLNARLTDRVVSDAISAARLMAAARPAVSGDSLFDALQLSAAVVPSIIAPIEMVGPVQAGLPGVLGRLVGRPVFCCANDTWAAVLGLGALREGYAYNISGTTEVFGMLGGTPAVADGLLTVEWGRGLYQLGGPGLNGADTMSWLLGLLGGENAHTISVGSALQALLERPRLARPLLFLPYLRGERVPHWDPHRRGAFIGLDRDHGPGDLAWAVLEGVAALNRMVLERAEAGFGRQAIEIRLGGGGGLSPDWCQTKADFCERPVVVGETAQPGLLGSAIVAWTGLGRFGSLAAAQDGLVQVAHQYRPNLARRQPCREIWLQFQAADAALSAVSRALGEIDVA